MVRMLIDTDTASDDAVALVMALQHPDVEIEAITVVAGNVPLPQAVQNALYTVELCGKSTPVYAGVAKPILRDLETAEFVHGTDGMGDIGLPLTGRTPADEHAVDVILNTFAKEPGEIVLVTLGPLTNIAVALLREPELAHQVKHCYAMAGSGAAHGNVTPSAEFNVWCDPEAAKIVFESGMPLTMVGWDMSWKYATFSPEDAAALRKIGTPLAEFCVDIQAYLNEYALKETKLAGFDLPDPITMAVAIDPSMAQEQLLYIEVTTGEGLHRGQTIPDVLDVMHETPNVRMTTHVEREAFVQMLHECVG